MRVFNRKLGVPLPELTNRSPRDDQAIGADQGVEASEHRNGASAVVGVDDMQPRVNQAATGILNGRLDARLEHKLVKPEVPRPLDASLGNLGLHNAPALGIHGFDDRASRDERITLRAVAVMRLGNGRRDGTGDLFESEECGAHAPIIRRKARNATPKSEKRRKFAKVVTPCKQRTCVKRGGPQKKNMCIKKPT